MSSKFWYNIIQFQSTHPVRGATVGVTSSPVNRVISIHAPREGCDLASRDAVISGIHFNPRTP